MTMTPYMSHKDPAVVSRSYVYGPKYRSSDALPVSKIFLL